MCWGANVHGQLGNGTTTDSMNPTFVSGLEGTLELRTGHGFTCARIGTTGTTCDVGGMRRGVSSARAPVQLGLRLPRRELRLQEFPISPRRHLAPDWITCAQS
jgi:hypothetical protein